MGTSNGRNVEVKASLRLALHQHVKYGVLVGQ